MKFLWVKKQSLSNLYNQWKYYLNYENNYFLSQNEKEYLIILENILLIIVKKDELNKRIKIIDIKIENENENEKNFSLNEKKFYY